MTKYTTSNDSDWLDDLDFAQLRGLSVRDADALLTAQAERQQRPTSRTHRRHRVCETSTLETESDDDHYGGDDEETDDGPMQQDNLAARSAHSVNELRRDAEREQRERARIEAHSQIVFRRLHQRRDSHPHTRLPARPSPNASPQRPAQQPGSPRSPRRRRYRRSKPAQRPNAGSAGATQGNSGPSQRRHTHDPSQH